MPCESQGLDGVAADIAGPSGDKNRGQRD
jgi:hypothetical protein